MGRAGISTNVPYIFLHFSQQYTVHIMALRAKKSTWIFLMCACTDYSVAIFPGKYVHIYNRLARRKRIWRLCWFVAARISCGYILPRVNPNMAQIGTDNATRL